MGVFMVCVHVCVEYLCMWYVCGVSVMCVYQCACGVYMCGICVYMYVCIWYVCAYTWYVRLWCVCVCVFTVAGVL